MVNEQTKRRLEAEEAARQVTKRAIAARVMELSREMVKAGLDMVTARGQATRQVKKEEEEGYFHRSRRIRIRAPSLTYPSRSAANRKDSGIMRKSLFGRHEYKQTLAETREDRRRRFR